MLCSYLTENINTKIISNTHKQNNYNLNTYLAVRFGAFECVYRGELHAKEPGSDTNCNDPTTLDFGPLMKTTHRP